MMTRRALQLAPFPIPDAPATGGQVRVAEMAKAYAAAGWTVDRCIVHDRTSRTIEPGDVMLGWWDRHRRRHIGPPKGISNLRHVWAWRSSRSAGALMGQFVRRAIPPYRVIQCEHPWDFDFAWRLREAGICRDAVLVYSAHNIEADLHAAAWQCGGQWSRAGKRLVAAIREHEIDVARRADLCWAVSETDAAFLRTGGARRVELLPNGVHSLAAPVPQQELVGTPYALFVASDHVPNLAGFQQWIPRPLDLWLPPGTAIVIAGTLGRALRRNADVEPDMHAKRLLDLGVVARDRLDQLIHHAHAVILPVGSGGGTSLKAAEALVSGRPVITTADGIRGFERFASQPRVSIARAPVDFRDELVAVLSAQRRPPQVDPDCTSLTWSHSLAAVERMLRALPAS